MERRNTLKWLGLSALGLNFPAAASQSTDKVPIDAMAAGDTGASLSVTPAVACRVIGVGDAGSNILLAAWSGGLLQAKDCQSEFACVSMRRQSIRAVIEANRLHPGIAPIRTVQLGRFGAGGNANIARAAARKHHNALRSLIDGADVVILVCGVGGGTGSSVAPALGSIAQKAGALTLGVIVTPFRWELGRYPNALQAVKELERECHYLASLSNQEVGEAMGEDATLGDLIIQQELLSAACIHKLMQESTRYFIDRRNCPA